MHGCVGVGLIAVSLGLLVAGFLKRQSRRRKPIPLGAIRPQFAAMGEIVRPMILFVVGLFAVKISFFYFVLGGWGLLTPIEYAGIMAVLAAYAFYIVCATTKLPVAQPARDTEPVEALITR